MRAEVLLAVLSLLCQCAGERVPLTEAAAQDATPSEIAARVDADQAVDVHGQMDTPSQGGSTGARDRGTAKDAPSERTMRDSPAEAPSLPGTCTRNSDCPNGFWCSPGQQNSCLSTDRVCTAQLAGVYCVTGTCVRQHPEYCKPNFVLPVCACDGAKHSNDCQAQEVHGTSAGLDPKQYNFCGI